MNKVKIAKYSYIISSAILMLSGCLILFVPNITIAISGKLAGAAILLAGIAKLYGYFSDDLYKIAFQFDLAFGILTIMLGGYLLFFSNGFQEYVTMAIAAFVIVNSLFTVQNSLEAKTFGVTTWWILLIGGILAAAAGTLAMIMSGGNYLSALISTGAALLLDGIQNIIVAVFAVNADKNKK